MSTQNAGAELVSLVNSLPTDRLGQIAEVLRHAVDAVHHAEGPAPSAEVEMADPPAGPVPSVFEAAVATQLQGQVDALRVQLATSQERELDSADRARVAEYKLHGLRTGQFEFAGLGVEVDNNPALAASARAGLLAQKRTFEELKTREFDEKQKQDREEFMKRLKVDPVLVGIDKLHKTQDMMANLIATNTEGMGSGSALAAPTAVFTGDCYACGQPGHRGKDCPASAEVKAAYAAGRGSRKGGRGGGRDGNKGGRGRGRA